MSETRAAIMILGGLLVIAAMGFLLIREDGQNWVTWVILGAAVLNVAFSLVQLLRGRHNPSPKQE